MKHLIFVLITITSFTCGLLVSRVGHVVREGHSPLAKPASMVREFDPVRVTIPPIKESSNSRVPYDHYYAVVENMSNRPVRYYVLGFGTQISNVGAPGFMSDNGGRAYTYQDLRSATLAPGETRMIPIKATAVFSEEAFAWVDYVEFTDGSMWGDNKSRTQVISR
jgi:hypothetical protein